MSGPRPSLPARVAVVGAGVAGALCARALADGGLTVTVFDKARGPGGRLATRRAELARPAPAEPLALRFDHGAPGFGARSPEFLHWAEQASAAGVLARWQPRVAPGSYAPLDDPTLWLPQPDMPALCRVALAGLPLQAGRAVAALRHGPAGWALDAADGPLGEGFDAVVLTLPPPQAAPLLQPHQTEWARRARAVAMRPTWTLMAVTDAAPAEATWDLAWPAEGPLASVVRQDAKPGRTALEGRATWVVHATATWSQTHLEAEPEAVQAALQAALAEALGRTPAWQHAVVHRWRYATAPREAAAPGRCLWDAALGLGQCGDALGGSGVEGAWASARALAAQVLARFPRPSPGLQAAGDGLTPDSGLLPSSGASS